ncbi:hypothetical protein ACFLS7_06840, partial [Bacteroidota bacterium]
IMGSAHAEQFPSWKRAKFTDIYYLTIHPDLPYCHVNSGGFETLLLGFILDPDHPEHSNEMVVQTILGGMESIDDLFTKNLTDNLGGRWILMIHDGKETRMFHDAAGLRQICFMKDPKNVLWCGSTSAILAEQFNLKIGKEAQEFIDSPQMEHAHEWWWPGTTTPFEEILQLLPNFYLDLKTGDAHRYWPNKHYDYPIPYQEGIEKSATLLKKLCNAGYRRFPIEGTLSAGYDSRTILAASKDFAKEIEYLTLIYWSYTEESADASISKSLTQDLGLDQKLVKCLKKSTKEFDEIYFRNVTTAHPAYASINETRMHHYPQDKVAIKGTVSSEVMREQYIDKTRKKDGKNFAQISGFNGSEFMEKHLQMWLDEALPYAKKYNVHINEMYGWEQQTGKWQAMTQAEGDIVQEVFVPFNCRNLIMTMLQVNDKYRRPFYYKLYYEMVKFNWPECNKYPMNPHKRGWKPRSKNIMRALGIYPLFITLLYKFYTQQSHF